MPEKAEKSEKEWKADFNQIKSFCVFEQEALQRGQKLKGFETLMKSKEPSNCDSWTFFDRTYMNEIPQESLIHNLSKEITQNTFFATQYDPLTDGLFLSIYYKTPPGWIFWKQWTFNKQSFPEY